MRPLFATYLDSLNIKLTALRKTILLLLWSSDRPVKAYELLTDLLKIKPNAMPPTVYRALDFFVSHGVVHKIESMQSYVLCCSPKSVAACDVLMVCHKCKDVIEMQDSALVTFISQVTKSYDFTLQQDVLELQGVCAKCHTCLQK